MNLQEFGEYLKNIRKNKDISLRQVDYSSEVTFSNLSMIESGKRRATPFVLKELSKVYHIDYIDLLEKAEYIDLAEAERIKEANSTDIGNIAFPSSTVPVPVLGVVKAGYNYLAQENWIDTVEVDKKLAEGNELFALAVKGDSMLPDLKENDIVIIKKQDDFENGNIVVALINGNEATIKKAKKSDMGILLQPINPAYEPLIFSKEDIENIPVRIIGVVKELKRRF